MQSKEGGAWTSGPIIAFGQQDPSALLTEKEGKLDRALASGYRRGVNNASGVLSIFFSHFSGYPVLHFDEW